MGETKPRSWLIGVVLFGLVLAACGGTSVEVTDFCESVVEAEASISNGPGEDVAAWAGQITETLTELEAVAPDAVSGAVGTMTGILIPAIESGDEEAMFAGLESTEFREASEVVDGYMTDECGWQVADVTAVELDRRHRVADLATEQVRNRPACGVTLNIQACDFERGQYLIGGARRGDHARGSHRSLDSRDW